MSLEKNQASDKPPPGGGFFVRPLFLCLAIMAVTMAIRMPLLSIPFERDEGEYAYIGWRMGFDELPYRDWVDQKPPGVFWVYRLALGAPMEPERAVHLAGALFAAVSAGVLFVLARRFLGAFWAAAGGVLFGILSADPTVQGTAANTEIFMQLPLILSSWALLCAAAGRGGGVWFMVLCGVCAGLATLFKQVAAFHCVFLALVFPVFCARERRAGRTPVFAAWLAGGVVAVWAAVMVCFRLEHGWDDLMNNVFFHNFDYIGALGPAERWATFKVAAAGLFKTQAIVWLFSIAGCVVLLLGRQLKWFLFLSLWMAAAAVGACLSGYFFPHYYQPLLPALSLAAVAGASGLDNARWWGAAPAWFRRTALAGALGLLPVLAMFPFVFRYTPEEAAGRIYPGNPFAVMPELGRRLAAVTGPEDRVFVYGSEPELLFYARRASATRYIFLFPLFGPYANAREKQVATSLEIIRARPAAAFYLPNELFDLPGRESYLATWSFKYLHENFQRDRLVTVDRAGVFHVQPAGNGPPPARGMIGELLVRNGIR